MDNSSKRNLGKRKCIAQIGSHCFSGSNCLTYFYSVRCKDVSLFTIGILNQSDKSSPDRIVFDRSNRSGNIELISLEVNDTVTLLVATAHIAHGHTTAAIASSARLHRCEKAF